VNAIQTQRPQSPLSETQEILGDLCVKAFSGPSRTADPKAALQPTSDLVISELGFFVSSRLRGQDAIAGAADAAERNQEILSDLCELCLEASQFLHVEATKGFFVSSRLRGHDGFVMPYLRGLKIRSSADVCPGGW